MSANATPSSGGSEEGLTKIRTTIRRVILGSTILATVLVVTLVLFAWHPWTDWGSAFGGQGGSTTYQPSAATVSISSHCPGELRVVDLTSTRRVVINPNGLCVVKWGVESGRVYLINKAGKAIEVGPEGGNFDTFWVESAQAVGSEARLRYKLTAS